MLHPKVNEEQEKLVKLVPVVVLILIVIGTILMLAFTN